MSTNFHQVVQQIKKKPFIQFLWGELPDAKRRQVFAKTETINLLIEGIHQSARRISFKRAIKLHAVVRIVTFCGSIVHRGQLRSRSKGSTSYFINDSGFPRGI